MADEILTFSEESMRKLARDHDRLRREFELLRQQIDSQATPRYQVQPVIGKTEGTAGTTTGTYQVEIQHGPYRNEDNDGDGEFDAYRVEAKPWDSNAKDKTATLLLQAPFGNWYSWLPCPRLCKTMSDTTYPSDPANTFEFVYVLLSYTKTQGTQTQTFTDESVTAQGVGQDVEGAYIPEGTYCLAVEQPNGRTLLIPLECA